MEALLRAFASADVSSKDIASLQSLVAPLFNSPNADCVAKIASESGANLLALAKQCITSIGPLPVGSATLPILFEAALLCVRALFALRARLVCAPLSLEGFLRKLLVDAYSKKLFSLAARIGATLTLRIFEHVQPDCVSKPSWSSLHNQVADISSIDWASISAMVLTSKTSGSNELNAAVPIFVPSIIAWVTCLSEIKNESSLKSTSSIVEHIGIPWVQYSDSIAKEAASHKHWETLGKVHYKVLVQLNSFAPQVDKFKTRLDLARCRFSALSLLFKSSSAVDLTFAVPQAFSTLNYVTQIVSDENTVFADIESTMLECLQSAQYLSMLWRSRIDIQKSELFDLVHFELQLSSSHRTNNVGEFNPPSLESLPVNPFSCKLSNILQFLNSMSSTPPSAAPVAKASKSKSKTVVSAPSESTDPVPASLELLNGLSSVLDAKIEIPECVRLLAVISEDVGVSLNRLSSKYSGPQSLIRRAAEQWFVFAGNLLSRLPAGAAPSSFPDLSSSQCSLWTNAARAIVASYNADHYISPEIPSDDIQRIEALIGSDADCRKWSVESSPCSWQRGYFYVNRALQCGKVSDSLSSTAFNIALCCYNQNHFSAAVVTFRRLVSLLLSSVDLKVAPRPASVLLFRSLLYLSHSLQRCSQHDVAWQTVKLAAFCCPFLDFNKTDAVSVDFRAHLAQRFASIKTSLLEQEPSSGITFDAVCVSMNDVYHGVMVPSSGEIPFTVESTSQSMQSDLQFLQLEVKSLTEIKGGSVHPMFVLPVNLQHLSTSSSTLCKFQLLSDIVECSHSKPITRAAALIDRCHAVSSVSQFNEEAASHCLTALQLLYPICVAECSHISTLINKFLPTLRLSPTINRDFVTSDSERQHALVLFGSALSCYAELSPTYRVECQLGALYVWSLINNVSTYAPIDLSLCESLANMLVQIENNSASSTESKLFSTAVSDIALESQQLEPLQDTISRIEHMLGGMTESTSKSAKKPAKSTKSTKKVEQVDSCCDIVLSPHQSSWQTLISMLQIADQFAFKMNTQFQLLALRSSLNLARQQFQSAEIDRDDYILFVAFVSEKCASALVLFGLHRFAIPFILHAQRLFDLFDSATASSSLCLTYGRVCAASTMIEIVTRLDSAADQLSRFQAAVECLQSVIHELTAIPKLTREQSWVLSAAWHGLASGQLHLFGSEAALASALQAMELRVAMATSLVQPSQNSAVPAVPAATSSKAKSKTSKSSVKTAAAARIENDDEAEVKSQWNSMQKEVKISATISSAFEQVGHAGLLGLSAEVSALMELETQAVKPDAPRALPAVEESPCSISNVDYALCSKLLYQSASSIGGLQALVQSFLLVGSLFDQIGDNKRADHYMRLGAHLCVMHELPLNTQTNTSWQSRFQLHCDAVRARQQSDRPFSLIGLLQAAATPSIDPFFVSPTPKSSSAVHSIDSHYLEMLMRQGDRSLEQGDVSAACSTWKEAARLVRKALTQSSLAQVMQPGVISPSASTSITESDVPASLATSQIAPNLALLACRLARRRAAALVSSNPQHALDIVLACLPLAKACSSGQLTRLYTMIADMQVATTSNWQCGYKSSEPVQPIAKKTAKATKSKYVVAAPISNELSPFLTTLDQPSNEFSAETALFGALKAAFVDGIPHVIVPLCLRLASILGRQHIKVSSFLLSHAAGLMARKQILTCWHQERLTTDSEALSSPFEISRDLQSEFTKFENLLPVVPEKVVVVQMSLSSDGLHLFLSRFGGDASPLVIRIRFADEHKQAQSIEDMIDTFDDMELNAEPAPAAKKKTVKVKADAAPSKTVVKPKSSRREVSRNVVQASNDVDSSVLPDAKKPVNVERKNMLTEALNEFDAIMSASHKSTHQGGGGTESLAERKQWWADRKTLDNRLQSCLISLEDNVLGAWKGLLLGSIAECASTEQTCIDNTIASLTSLEHHRRQSLRQSATISDSASFSEAPDCPTMIASVLKAAPACTDAQLRAVVAWWFGIVDEPACASLVKELNPADIDVLGKAVAVIRTQSQVLETAYTRATANNNARQHVVLVLDKHLQRVPWESCPLFAEHCQPVSRLPSIHFLQPRLQPVATTLSNGFYVLNPSGDLTSTQTAFEAPFQTRGWRGVAGRAPSAAEMTDGLLNSDIYVYCGHSGGERYLKAEALLNATLSKGRTLSCTALLIGCSSGLLQHQGQYDATGIVMAYLMAGCPAVVANLWDVTDGEIDRLCADLIQRWLGPADSKKIVKPLTAALPEARTVCNLPFLTGAASIMYGLPSHLL